MHKCLVMVSVAALGLAAAGQGAAAQVPLVPKASFGILGGINVAKLGGSDLSGVSVGNRTGFDGGLFVTLHLSPNFGIEPEVMYSQQGMKTSFGGIDATMQLDYIQVPVLLRFDLPSASTPIHPFFIAGPSASYQVKCGLAATSGGSSGSVTCADANTLLAGNFAKKTFDYAAVGGAGVAIGMGGTAVSVSARYTYGFNDTFEGSSIKNRYFSILAGLTF